MTITKTAKSVALRLSTKSTSKASAIDPSKHKTDFLKSLNTDKVQRITIQLILLWYTRLWSKTIVCYPVFKCSKTRRFCSVFKVISLSNAQDPIIPYHVKQCKQNPQNMCDYFCPSPRSMKKRYHHCPNTQARTQPPRAGFSQSKHRNDSALIELYFNPYCIALSEYIYNEIRHLDHADNWAALQGKSDIFLTVVV